MEQQKTLRAILEENDNTNNPTKSFEVEDSLIYISFEDNRGDITINTLLDWRNFMLASKNEFNRKHPTCYYDNEIDAVDFLLDYKNRNGILV